MRFSNALTGLIVLAADLVSAAATPSSTLAPALPPSSSGMALMRQMNKTQAIAAAKQDKVAQAKFQTTSNAAHKDITAGAGCTNPSERAEWNNLSDGERNDFISSVQCLMNKAPSGQYPAAHSRYEDIVALHQSVTLDVHGNSKSLIWHRYLLSAFENIMRQECGYSSRLPWFDEEKVSNNFANSPIFTNAWLGSVNIGGACVTDGQFAGHTVYIGPGTENTPHCLSRNSNTGLESDTAESYVDACNSRTSYVDMATCCEDGPHNEGHNGIGGVMLDVHSSPGDPVFWLHHGFIDRNYWTWQNMGDASRVQVIGGVDREGNPLTPQTVLSVNGLIPETTISNMLNPVGGPLCYTYDY